MHLQLRDVGGDNVYIVLSVHYNYTHVSHNQFEDDEYISETGTCTCALLCDVKEVKCEYIAGGLEYTSAYIYETSLSS